MQGVVQSGSGVRLRDTWRTNQTFTKEMLTGYPYELTNPIAGKTGTTQNQSDGWFMGIVPNLVTGVWVGCEDRAAHFRNITYGQGASTALPIWGLYMKACYEDETLGISKADFEEPQDLSINTDCSKTSDTSSNTTDDDDDDLDFDF